MCEEFENERKKEQKHFDLPELGFETQLFINFPAHDLNKFSCEVRSPRSNQNKLLKEIGLYMVSCPTRKKKSSTVSNVHKRKYAEHN